MNQNPERQNQAGSQTAMNTISHSSSFSDFFGHRSSFPSDLRQWTDSRTLIVTVLEAVQSLYCRVCDAAGRTDSSAAVGPELVLGVLTYCYATGVHPTVDIERCMGSDPATRYLCLNRRVEARRLQLFRGQNRELLKRCLACVLRRCWESWHASESIHTDVPGGFDTAWSRHFADEAESRIQQALWADFHSVVAPAPGHERRRALAAA